MSEAQKRPDVGEPHRSTALGRRYGEAHFRAGHARDEENRSEGAGAQRADRPEPEEERPEPGTGQSRERSAPWGPTHTQKQNAQVTQRCLSQNGHTHGPIGLGVCTCNTTHV